MSEWKGSPGPWKYRDDSHSNNRSPNAQIMDARGRVVCDIAISGAWWDDMQLILTACNACLEYPDPQRLAEALPEILEAATRLIGGPDDPTKAYDPVQWQSRLRAALTRSGLLEDSSDE